MLIVSWVFSPPTAAANPFHFFPQRKQELPTRWGNPALGVHCYMGSYLRATQSYMEMRATGKEESWPGIPLG